MVIKNRSKTCLLISACIILVALVMTIFGRGLNLGIDFEGGMSVQYDLKQDNVSRADVEKVLSDLDIGAFTITQQGTSEVIIRVKDVKPVENGSAPEGTPENAPEGTTATDIAAIGGANGGNGSEDAAIEAIQAKISEGIMKAYPNAVLKNTSYVGPVAGASLVKNAILSVLIAAALMLVYIAIRFDLNSGLSAVFGLIHDVLIMLSIMIIFQIQMNSPFIAAALTIVGYSINNTIVIFDRIRENAKKMPTAPREEVTNVSIRESLGRTICTTVTTLITVVLLCILGVTSIREFALPILIGILSGVYSANMINGYVWAFLEEKRRARKAKA